jgi:hypothetical protein
MGGIGNQLFQYAAARRLAHRRTTSLCLDTGRLGDRSAADTRRDYELNVFTLPQHRVISSASDHRLGLLLQRFNPFSRAQVYREAAQRFDPRVLELPDNTCLDGYWQSERYFSDAAGVIRSDLAFRRPPEGENARLLDEIRSGTAISLHVRRGDYVNNPTTKSFHGICSIEYYKDAMSWMHERVSGARLYVFSDDPEWCRKELPLPAGSEIVSHNQGSRAWEDLRLMSSCRHHIIANSSFSWWGAWLNPAADKHVIAPRSWFAATDAPDLIPEGWTRL